MTSAPGVYAWLKARGYWVSGDRQAAPGCEQPLTHLALDGGKASVPDDAHGTFLNAYATALVAGGRRPCLAELRTPVFRMFLDLDTSFEDTAAALAARDDGGVEPLVRALHAVLMEAHDTPGAAPDPGLAAAVGPCWVCASSADAADRKLGFHLVWPEVLVDAPTALALRARMVEALEKAGEAQAGEGGEAQAGGGRQLCGVVTPWAKAVDAAVFRGNGLRMPWAAKGRGNDSYYAPRWKLFEGAFEAVAVAETSVAVLRCVLPKLCVRVHGRGATLRVAGEEGGGGARLGGGSVSGASLDPYRAVLPLLARALPAQFAGQQFTGLMSVGTPPNAFMLRSTARYCLNLGRAHHTNNVYFMLTRSGVSQRCYCRCETTEGRAHGMCRDFAGPAWVVPRAVVAAFFGDAPPPQAAPRPKGAKAPPRKKARGGGEARILGMF